MLAQKTDNSITWIDHLYMPFACHMINPISAMTKATHGTVYRMEHHLFDSHSCSISGDIQRWSRSVLEDPLEVGTMMSEYPPVTHEMGLDMPMHTISEKYRL